VRLPEQPGVVGLSTVARQWRSGCLLVAPRSAYCFLPATCHLTGRPQTPADPAKHAATPPRRRVRLGAEL